MYAPGCKTAYTRAVLKLVSGTTTIASSAQYDDITAGYIYVANLPAGSNYKL